MDGCRWGLNRQSLGYSWQLGSPRSHPVCGYFGYCRGSTSDSHRQEPVGGAVRPVVEEIAAPVSYRDLVGLSVAHGERARCETALDQQPVLPQGRVEPGYLSVGGAYRADGDHRIGWRYSQPGVGVDSREGGIGCYRERSEPLRRPCVKPVAEHEVTAVEHPDSLGRVDWDARPYGLSLRLGVPDV